jgi:adenine-specific DNA-methyltransferase
VKLVPLPHLLVTCMNFDAPRLVANEAGVRHLNSVHGLILKPSERRLGMRYLPIGMLNSLTLLGAELVGRSYGGGVLKLEPKEADLLPVPAPAAIAKAKDGLDGIRPKVEDLLVDGRLADAVGLVDECLLEDHLGMLSSTVEQLDAARRSAFARRASRSRGK